MADQISVSRDISAPPETVWSMIADVTRMGDWSPETIGCTWTKGALGPEVGAHFRGRNRNGRRNWSTSSRVVACEHGRRFAFEVTSGPFKVSRWEYEFEPTDAGCRATETWTDQRGWLVTALGKPVSGVADRASHNRESMAETLRRLAEAAESD
jgi:uncharacterized protein YndB with AHSA1/START domain